MITETVLSPEQIEGFAHRQVFSLTAARKQVLEIEQSVLQSPEVQALRKDAERYWALRQMNWFDSPLCVVVNPQSNLKLGAFCPSVDELDTAIDAAMEKQP